MTAKPLPNYIRTHRKRAQLTQGEVAFLLGAKSGAVVCRHERFKQTPSPQALIAYEILFYTPVRTLYCGMHSKVERKLLGRIRLLIRKLVQRGESRVAAKKLESLNAILERCASPGAAYAN